MAVYADSSFIVALYVPSGVDAFRLWRAVGEVVLPWTPIHRLEVRNAIRRRVKETRPERRLTHDQVVEALAAIDADVGVELQHLPIEWTDALRRAEEIGRQYTGQTGIRAYDLFQLAIAVETGHDTLLTYDGGQAETAALLGLTVYGA